MAFVVQSCGGDLGFCGHLVGQLLASLLNADLVSNMMIPKRGRSGCHLLSDVVFWSKDNRLLKVDGDS